MICLSEKESEEGKKEIRKEKHLEKKTASIQKEIVQGI